MNATFQQNANFALNYVKCINAYNLVLSQINEIKKIILTSQQWKTDQEWIEEVGEFITSPQSDYLMSAADFEVYASRV